MFRTIYKIVRAQSDILTSCDRGLEQTIIVIGEMHFIGWVQHRLLCLLENLYRATNFQLLGAEGPPDQFDNIENLQIDYPCALTDSSYFAELLPEKRAAQIFSLAYPGLCKSIEDKGLRDLAFVIDRHCVGFYLKSPDQTPSGFEVFERDMWKSLLRDVVVGFRSDAMVRRIYGDQLTLNIPVVVLYCGTAHTPVHEAYRPYSVLRTLNVLPVNYIVALPTGCRAALDKFLANRDPWDFYSNMGEEFGNPFETDDPYAEYRS